MLYILINDGVTMNAMNDEIIIVFPTKKQMDYLKQQKNTLTKL